MKTRLHGKIKVESLRNHSSEDVRALEELFAAGADAMPDSHHKGFFEVEGGTRVFYVYISPVSAGVFLVAEWPKERETSTVLMKRAYSTA